MFYNVFRTQFPTCGKWSFPIGKVKEMENQNRVLESFCFPMELEYFFGLKYRKVLQFHCDLQRFQDAISDTSKPHENKWFCTLWIPVLELLCFPMKPEHFSGKVTENIIISIMIYNVFRTRFPTCGKWCFPIGKVNKWEIKIVFWIHFVFQWNWSTSWMELQKSTSFLLCLQCFKDVIPDLRKMKFSHWES